MILTCPACATQYVVKDGAIPPAGRQVRCASCRHSWHQSPEPGDDAVETAAAEPASEPVQHGPEQPSPDPGRWDERAVDNDPIEAPPPGYAPADMAIDQPEPAEGEAPAPWREADSAADTDAGAAAESEPPAEPTPWDEAAPLDDDFSPFRERDPAERRGGLLPKLLIAALLIAALAAAFWFLAPAEWRERAGLAGLGETPLLVRITHSDRQTLASGNELLAISGRVTNPTAKQQTVPPIHAQLRSNSGQLVYSWTIAPPARRLQPGASATFNSAEVDVPAGAEELTVTLGAPRG